MSSLLKIIYIIIIIIIIIINLINIVNISCKKKKTLCLILTFQMGNLAEIAAKCYFRACRLKTIMVWIWGGGGGILTHHCVGWRGISHILVSCAFFVRSNN